MPEKDSDDVAVAVDPLRFEEEVAGPPAAAAADAASEDEEEAVVVVLLLREDLAFPLPLRPPEDEEEDDTADAACAAAGVSSASDLSWFWGCRFIHTEQNNAGRVAQFSFMRLGVSYAV